MLKNYDISVLYHPVKANVVLASLSRMTRGSVSHIDEAKKDLVKEVHWLARLEVMLKYSLDGGFFVGNNSDSSLVVYVNSKQHLNKSLMMFKEAVHGKLNETFSPGGKVF